MVDFSVLIICLMLPKINNYFNSINGNLNSTRLTPLLEALLHMGLLDKASHFDQKVVYMTTLRALLVASDALLTEGKNCYMG
jgi:hypothetical protein